ncbi:Nn.00g072820.m01.CDS01 [Neocucurbitaria sp. VM-36]
MSGFKRGNVFDQGRPECPYEERDEPADVPQRATAAQLATRKIKTAKVRRPAGASSVSNRTAPTRPSPRAQTPPPACRPTDTPSRGGARYANLTQSANFAAPQSGFNFGSSAPAPSNNSANNFNFGSTGAFGGGAANSFPPAQSSAPSNSFANSSFPAFGAGSQSTGFDPQPPSAGFNFTAGGSNPFASSNTASPMNGTSSVPSFGAFGTQPQGNPFGTLGQSNTSSSASGGMFGATSGPSQTTTFGITGSSAPNATSTPAPASQPFTFGASLTAQNNTSAPASTNMFSGFGTPAQATAPAQNNGFGAFGASAQKNTVATETATPQPNLFSGFGTSTQDTEKTTTIPSATKLFDFSSNTPKSEHASTPAPTTNFHDTSVSAAPSTSAPASAPAPANNLFAKLSSAPSTTPSLFNFTPTAQTPQGQEKTSGTSNNLFSSLKPADSSSISAAETPKPNLFASLAKPNGTTTNSPSGSTSGFSIFGASQNQDTASGSTEKPSEAATRKVSSAPKPSLFNGFSTPQPATTVDAEKPLGGLFNTAQPKTSSGIFSQPFQPENLKSGNLFKPQSTPSRETPREKDMVAQQSSKEAFNPLSKPQTPSAERSSLFNTAKEPAPASAALSMPTLTGAAATTSTEAPKGSELPKIPKVHVPKEWAVSNVTPAQSIDGLYKHVSELTMQLQALNERYRQQLSTLPVTADWSSISLWHFQHATEIKKKIDNAKKQRAAAKGITGNESSLSTKRKVNEESPENRDVSPSKRARPSEGAITPTPQPSAPTPMFNPPATSTSNMFAKAIGNKPSTPSGSVNLFMSRTGEKPNPEPSIPTTTATGFTPSSSTTKGNTTSEATTTSIGFTPAFGGGGSKTTSNSTGFQPNFGSGSTGGTGGFFTQFSKTAKTYEELAAERKAKAMAEDYDSDEETEEQWSSRYDKKEAERLAAEKKQIAATPTFSVPASTKSFGSTTPSSNPFAGLVKPVSGASTPGLFTSRVASPAPSIGGQSVFDAPSTAQTPSSNIFGHLSSGPSSNNQDESDEDDGEQGARKLRDDRPIGSVESTTPPKRKFGESETESDETVEETMRRKKQETGSKGSLLSRITREDDDDAESEKENDNSASIFGQTNGTKTPTNKPFQFFDFGAAGSKTGSPKSDSFAGDQTFKPGTPIKFGGAPATEKKDGAPKFVFQPATPSAADFSTTPAKPPPTSLFNFGSSTSGSSLLAPNAGFSGPGSVASSVLSSRAGTPLSEADTSAASAAEDDEEGGKQEQVDFARLTEEELEALDVVFHAEVALAKHAVDKGDGSKTWANIAKGPLWILKDKVTAKCFVRIRIASGATPLNYQILPALQASVTGSSKKQVVATMPKKEGGLNQVYYALKTPEIAEEFATKYNGSLPSN